MDRETIEFFQPYLDSFNREFAAVRAEIADARADVADARAEAKADNARLRQVVVHYSKQAQDLLAQLVDDNVSMRDAIEDLQRRMAAVEQRLPPPEAAA